MAQSESSQVLEPLEEAEELTTMKTEIMQIVSNTKFRWEKKPPEQVADHLEVECQLFQALREKISKNPLKAFWQPKQHTSFFERHCWILRRNENPNQRNWNNNNNDWQVQFAEQEHTEIGRMHWKRSNFWHTIQNFISQEYEYDKNDLNHLDGSGDHDWTNENPISVVPNNLRNNDVEPNYTQKSEGIYLPSR